MSLKPKQPDDFQKIKSKDQAKFHIERTFYTAAFTCILMIFASSGFMFWSFLSQSTQIKASFQKETLSRFSESWDPDQVAWKQKGETTK